MKGKNSLFSACIIYLILGIVLFFFPGTVTGLFCTVVGVLLVLYGGMTVYSFFRSTTGSSFLFQFELIQGVIAIIAGIFFLLHPDFILSIIPTILGLYVLIDALVNLKRGLDMRNCGYAGWTTTLIMSVISLLCGLLILCNRYATGLLLWRAIGVVFLYQGISDLLAIHTMGKLKI